MKERQFVLDMTLFFFYELADDIIFLLWAYRNSVINEYGCLYAENLSCISGRME